MRTLFVLNSLGTGGTERSLSEMLPHFRNAGLEVTIAVFRPRPDGVEGDVRERGFDVRLLEARDPLSRVRELRRLIRDVRPSLVHTSLYDADIVGRVAAAGIAPVLTSLVNQSYDPLRLTDPNIRGHRLFAARMVDQVTARALTAHFHAVTASVKAAGIRDLGLAPESITVIERGRSRDRLGTPDPERRRRVREMLGVPWDAPVFVNVGRHEYQKGQVNLVRAFARVSATLPDARLWIVGRDGRASNDLRGTIRELQLGDRARLLGHRDDVPDLLAASDCFAFPSLFEGMGGAAVEALGLGIPLVTTPTMIGVVEPDVTALVVPAADAAALAEGMQRVVTDGGLATRLRAAGLASFDRRFSLERSASKMLSLYWRVAELPPAPRARNVSLKAEPA